MNNRWRQVLAAGLAAAVLGAGIAATTSANADALSDRKKAMKSMSKANKALQKAAKSGNKSVAMKQAAMIVATADKIESLFPSNTGRSAFGAKKSRAKDNIWSDWSKFQAAAANLKKSATMVASGDLSAAGGISKACGGCHKPFRAPKAKK